MKKELIILIIFGIILISPIILAQEQVQTYSGFDRFVDNVKMFFTFGQDGKVALSLEIREKEVDSAIANIEDEEESDKNLENAWEKLQFIQEKVSLNTAEEVKESSNEIRNRIREEEKLSENFEVYALEEEKTGLTAEWVIEKNGEEGQNVTNEVVVNGTIGQTRVVEIEKRVDEIDNEISNWVVEHTYAEGTGPGGEAGVVVEGGLAKVVKNEVAQGDNGLKPEVKTSVAKEESTNHVDEGLDEGGLAPGTTAGGGGSTDSVDDTYDDESVNNGDCGEGIVCGGEDDAIEGGEGTEGTNDVAPATDSNEGDSSSDDGSETSGESNTESSSEGGESVTGEAIKEIPNNNFLTKFFKSIFGK